jgi:hypothetical protein
MVGRKIHGDGVSKATTKKSTEKLKIIDSRLKKRQRERVESKFRPKKERKIVEGNYGDWHKKTQKLTILQR